MDVIRRSRLLRFVAAITLVVMMALTTSATKSYALSGSSFESTDGNLVVNATKDWATAGINCPSVPGSTPTCGIDLASGQNDNAFGTGSKQDSACPSVVNGSIPNNKSDLTRFYMQHEKVNSNDYLYLAWERVNTLGTADMDFVFYQSNTACSATVGSPPVLTGGDLLITFDFAQGGSTVMIESSRWLDGTTSNGSVWTGTCESGGSVTSTSSTPCWSTRRDLDSLGYADGAVNDPSFISGCTSKNLGPCAVRDPILPDGNRTLPADTFGEAAVNLTTSGIFPANQCVNFGQGLLNSRSSTSFTSETKDYIAPIPVNLSNCGQIKVVKNTVPANSAQTFNFTGQSQTATAFPNTTNGAFSLTGQTASGANTYDSGVNTLLPGSYTVTEGAEPSGWVFSFLSCSSALSPNSPPVTINSTAATINLSEGDLVTCTYTNNQRQAPSLVTTPSTKVGTSTITGVGTGTSTATGFSMTVPIGSQISDTATFSGSLGTVAGTVSYNLYFAAPGVDPTTVCDAGHQIGLSSTFSNVALTGGAAQSPYYDTSHENRLGTYVWQDVYTPAASSNYNAVTETCGDEQVHIEDARILLTPGAATNVVGSPHVLTATVQSTLDGTTWSPVSGASVTFSITGDTSNTSTTNTSNGATFVGSSTCTTGAAGTCTASIADAKTGIVTIDAKAGNFTPSNLSVGSFTRETGDGVSSDSPQATKYYVDGKISISPASAINASGSPHTLTVTVQQDNGSGSGFVALANQSVSLSFASNAAGATFTGGASTAACVTGTDGTCTATINTTGVGAVTVNASTTFSITPAGCNTGAAICTATFNRSTGDGVSGDSVNAAKQYDNARISISPLNPVNVVGNPETFTITVQKATDQTSSGPTWTSVGAGVTVSYRIVIGTNTPSDASFVSNSTAAGSCPPSTTSTGNPNALTAQTDANGQIKVTVLSCMAGTIDVHASADVNFTRPAADPLYPANLVITRATGDSVNTALGGSADAVKTYLNPSTQLSVSDKLVGLDATANGTVTYTIYTSAADCSAQTHGQPDGSGTVTNGVVPSSTTKTVGPVGADYTGTIWFRAQFTGTLGGASQTYLSPCTESASST